MFVPQPKELKFRVDSVMLAGREGKSLQARKIDPIRVIELGDALAGGVNSTVARRHGIVTRGPHQFTAFFADLKRLVVIRRGLRDDSLQTSELAGTYGALDVHNGISLGMDPDGFLHMAYDHHAGPLQYRRSARPMDVRGWGEPVPMTGRSEHQVTYPQFLMKPAGPDDAEGRGRLLFLYRHGGSGDGDVCLKEYDHETGQWSDLAERFIKGMEQTPWTSNAYWDQPCLDSKGSLQLSWIWRINRGGPPDGRGFYNQTYCFARSPDGRRWFSSHGVELSLPLTPVNGEVIHASTPGATVFNMCGSAVDSQDRLHTATCAADVPGGAVEYRHLWFDGRTWQWDTLTDRGTGFDLSAAEFHGENVPVVAPDLLIDRRDRVYVFYNDDCAENCLVAQRLDPPDYGPPGKTFVLWEKDMAGSEPVVDRIRWRRDGVLTMYIQQSRLDPSGTAKSEEFSPARLVEWKVEGV